MSRRVQIATFHEQVGKKSGEIYLRAAFGPLDLLLFKDFAHPIIGADGQRTFPWNLVVSQNYSAERAGRGFIGLGDIVPDDKAPE